MLELEKELMALLILRKDGTPSQSKAARRVLEIVKNSKLSIEQMSYGLKFNLMGQIAKLPSTMNSKILFKDRRTGQARSIRNPDYQERLQALTMWLDHVSPPEKRVTLALDNSCRAFVLIACGDCMSRMDTHNIPKAVCDWLQQNNFVNNDRYVDALALTARTIWPNQEDWTYLDTHIYLVEHDPEWTNSFEKTLQYVFKMGWGFKE